MELTILGRCGPYPRAGECCSGYVLGAGNTHILLECGAGVLSRLRSVLDMGALDAVVLSHLHYDHCADMAVLRYALEQFPRAPLPVYCPAAPAEALAIFDHPVFDIRHAKDGMRVNIGDFALTFSAVRHSVPACGLRIEDGESSLFFTGDTGWFDALPGLASGADALLADCCYTDADAGKRGIHLSARQAGSLAREAGVKTLYCTHLWGGADTDDTVRKEAGFSPAVIVREGQRCRI